MYMGTRQVAAQLSIRPATLLKAVWDGRLPPPPKTPAGDFCWRGLDIQRARRVFDRSHARRKVETGAAVG